MLRAVPMVRVRVQVPGRQAAAATHAIARLGLLHLIDVAHGRVDAAPAGSHELLAAHRAIRDRIGRTLGRVGLAPPPLVGKADDPAIQDFEAERTRIEAALAPAEEAIDRASTARVTAHGEVEQLVRLVSRASALERDGVDPGRLASMRFATARIAVATEEALASLSTVLSPAPHLIQPMESAGPEVIAVLAAPASGWARVEAALRIVHVETVSPAVIAGRGPGDLDRALGAAMAAEADAADALTSLGAAHGDMLRALFGRAETCVLLLQAQARFGAAGRFVVISGWVPERAAARLRSAVMSAAPDAIVDVESPADLPEAPAAVAGIPILHRNPLLFRPFQPLVHMYDTPSYREVQPTAFFAVSFLIMFGLMFGDVGHGAVLCAAGYYLFRYMPRFLDYGLLLMEAGTASVLFGVLYGSFFGIEGALPVLWLDPAHDLREFMRVAITFGIVLVSVGLILNVINSWRAGERAAAVFGVRGLFGAFLYWTAVALAIRALMPRAVQVPPWLLGTVAVMAAALVVLRRPLIRVLQPARQRPAGPRPPPWLRALEGTVELVDALFAYLANTISFIRIAAFAAVHAGVFVAMFAVSDTLAQTQLGRPLSFAALVIGNVVLILLEGLTVSVQVLRLEYYEFFGKFFRGGGEMYRPLTLPGVHEKGGLS